jgi:hypothetical protein
VDGQQEKVSEIVDLISAQSNDLWPIALGLLIAAFSMFVHRREVAMSWFAKVCLLVSAIASFASLALGYGVKGALINSLDKFAKGEKWELGTFVEWLSFLQGGAIFVSLICFGIVFFLPGNFAAKAFGKIWGK